MVTADLMATGSDSEFVDEAEGEFELRCERSPVCVKSQHLQERTRCVCVCVCVCVQGYSEC